MKNVTFTGAQTRTYNFIKGGTFIDRRNIIENLLGDVSSNIKGATSPIRSHDTPFLDHFTKPNTETTEFHIDKNNSNILRALIFSNKDEPLVTLKVVNNDDIDPIVDKALSQLDKDELILSTATEKTDAKVNDFPELIDTLVKLLIKD